MKNSLRFGFLALVVTLGVSDSQAQAIRGEQVESASAIGGRSITGARSGGSDGEVTRVVLSKVTSLGTADYNASPQPVSHRGVRMIALTAGDRYSLSSNGSFAITDQVSQLNFVLPRRIQSLTMVQSVCLDRLQGMRIAGNLSGKMELSFRGTRLANGNYVVLEILGCGDLPTAAAQPTPIITLPVEPRPTPWVTLTTPTPRPTVTPTRTPTPIATPRPTPGPGAAQVGSGISAAGSSELTVFARLTSIISELLKLLAQD